MPYDPENPFGEFEEVAAKTEAAAPMSSTGRLPVFANYKGVCTTVDLKGDGVMVDKEIFEARTGTKGLKIFLEILEPEEVGGVKVKGEIHEQAGCPDHPRPPLGVDGSVRQGEVGRRDR
jgi:hypothetical protein